METIISPWLVYLISRADNIKGASIGILILCFVLCLFYIVGLDVNKDYDDNYEKYKKTWKPHVIKVLILGFIMLFSVVFIPTSKTLMTMIIVKNITYDRIESIIENGKDIRTTIKQDILDIINTINEKE